MKQHLGAKKIEQKIVPPCLQCTSLSLRISAIKHSQKNYKVNIKLQISSIETDLYVLSTYMVFIWVFFQANMGPRGNICFLLVIVDPFKSQGVIITGNRALPVIKFTLFLESSKQLNLLAQKTSFRHFQPL